MHVRLYMYGGCRSPRHALCLHALLALLWSVYTLHNKVMLGGCVLAGQSPLTRSA